MTDHNIIIIKSSIGRKTDSLKWHCMNCKGCFVFVTIHNKIWYYPDCNLYSLDGTGKEEEFEEHNSILKTVFNGGLMVL